MKDNPFTLMYGKTPYSLINRSNSFDEIIDTFESKTPYTMSFLITGIRGSGKTVLLRTISKKLKETDDWIVIDVNPQKIISALPEKLYYEGNIKKLYSEWNLSISVHGISLSIKKEKPIESNELVFEKLLKKASDSNKKILITIDEVEPTEEVKYFANFYQSMVGKDYKIYLLMTGLKENISALISAKSTSFLSRCPRVELEPLDLRDISRSYKEIFKIDVDKAIELAKITNGYAFAYQVLGYYLFESNNYVINENLMNKFDNYLEKNGYDFIWKTLTTKEKELCYAIASAKDNNINDIKDISTFNESNFNNYKRRLKEKDLIVTSYGKIEFVLPRFKEFVLLIKAFN